MIDSLINLDKKIFSFFNSSISNFVFDYIMPVITNQDVWVLPILLLLIYLIAKGRKRGKITVTILVVAVGLSDYSSAQILKPFFERLRPSHDILDNIRLLVDRGGKYGFVSSHAANTFSAAVILGYFYPVYKRYCFTLAAIVSFSRIYVGVHYPADVLFGSLLGYGLAWSTLSFWVIIRVRELKRGKSWINY